jgi:inosose dehydratase
VTHAPADRDLRRRIAAGPISWGVCEVPGWGAQLPPTRVLAEVRALGLRAVEAGPVGYLGQDAASIRALLDAQELALVGGFLPAVLHDPSRLEETVAEASRTASLYASAGAGVLVSATVVDLDWSPPVPLDGKAWDALSDGLARLDEIAERHGLAHVLHPHWGTLVQSVGDIERVLDTSDVKLCLDTGHLVLGNAQPATLARDAAARIGHVHLKDVRLEVAGRLRTGELTLVEATAQGLFCRLGEGDAAVADTLAALEAAGYAGWYVLEQDTVVPEDAVPPPGAGPVDDVRRSIEFLETVIPPQPSFARKEAVL